MTINFDKRLFNPLYWHLRKYLNSPEIRTILVYGSSSAAKSYSIMQALSIGVLENEYNVMAMRKTGADIKDSIYTDFKGFNSKLSNLIPDTYDIILNEIRIKKSRIRFRGLDDPERIKGIAEFTKINLDELTEYDYADFSQLQKRLRGRKNQQIIASWNPISGKHWIKKQLIDTDSWVDLPRNVEGIEFSELSEDSLIQINEKKDTILIRTTYKDNFWIVGHPKYSNVGFYDKHQINHLEGLAKTNPNDYRIYAKGLWGVASEGLVFSPDEWNIVDKIPDGAERLPFGLDFGFVNSKTALVKVYRANGELYFDCPIFETGLVTLKNPDYPNQKSLTQRLEENGIAKDWYIIADSANSEAINQLLNAGYTIIKADKFSKKTNAESKITEGIKIMKSFKKNITRRSVGMIDNFENYAYPKDNNGTYKERPEKINDDSIDAARYSILTKGRLWN